MNIMDVLEKCNLCPRNCNVNRYEKVGRCGARINPKIALADLHFYEEPCISGKSGSGAIFFSGCNLNCIYCQNYEISQIRNGKEITIEELSEEMLKLQEKGANNINLVTAFSYVPQIKEAVKIAKEKGLKIPIVYNSSGYENIETIKMLDGIVDVYLPDLKYYYNELAKSLSNVENYFDIATKAIKEMKEQVGQPIFNEDGIIQKGLIIRHLVLPNHLQNTKMVLKWIREKLGKETYCSIMAQYFPSYKAMNTDDVNRKLYPAEYAEIEDYVQNLGLINGYMQYVEENEEQYVPKFNKEQ
jgi:putative pyruvate formate lyase activating enzyme